MIKRGLTYWPWLPGVHYIIVKKTYRAGFLYRKTGRTSQQADWEEHQNLKDHQIGELTSFSHSVNFCPKDKATGKPEVNNGTDREG